MWASSNCCTSLFFLARDVCCGYKIGPYHILGCEYLKFYIFTCSIAHCFWHNLFSSLHAKAKTKIATINRYEPPLECKHKHYKRIGNKFIAQGINEVFPHYQTTVAPWCVRDFQKNTDFRPVNLPTRKKAKRSSRVQAGGKSPTNWTQLNCRQENNQFCSELWAL